VEVRQAWFIHESGFLDRIEPHDREVFLNTCPERRFSPGQTVFRAGDPAESLHIIAAGKVKLLRPTRDGRERIVAVCGPDDFIGEAFLMEPASDTNAASLPSYQVEAVALTQVMTCPISREQFVRVAAQAPGFALTFAEILASHLFYCREQLSSSYDPVKIRVTKILLEQAQRFGQPIGGSAWSRLETELKHEDFAALASATRVAVTMAFAELRSLGALKGSRGHYELDMPLLSELADGLSAT
jgi:CRP/FNR family cyclic AMP-dependent transcriptional regulator